MITDYFDDQYVKYKVRSHLESSREECKVLRERLVVLEENAELEKKCRFVSPFWFYRNVVHYFNLFSPIYICLFVCNP